MLCEGLKALASQDIRVMLLRDKFVFLDKLTELDILISEKEIDRAQDVLSGQGWFFYRNNKFLSHKYVAVKYYLNCLYILDIHISLIQNGLIYLDNSWFFLNSTEVEKNLYEPNEASYIYHLVMHTILGKRKLSPKYFEQINSLALTDDQIEEIYTVAKAYDIDDVFRKVIPDMINVLSDVVEVKRFREIIFPRLVSHDRGYSWRKFVCLFLRTYGFIVGRGRGIVIAFVGPDGAGKSSFIEELSTQLIDFGLPVRQAYMGPWDRNKLFTSKVLEYYGANPNDIIVGLDSVSGKVARLVKLFKGLVRRYLYYFNVPLEFWFRYLKYVLPQSRYGRIVLLDRYVYDIEVGYKNKEIKNNKKIHRLITLLCPKPDITVLLYNEPKVIWSRKKEDRIDDIEWSMNKYINLSNKYGFEKILTNKQCKISVSDFIKMHLKKIYSLKSDTHLRD
ncbi:MAG: hypothetical protein PF692_04600 [Kiritimatiellae bacterium]|jgi:thymidylate kinase|nr:hypothetical protein [Kiritimatiellia bacterium]